MTQNTKDKLLTFVWGAIVIAAVVMLVRALQTFQVVYIILAAVLALVGKYLAPRIPIPESAQARGYTHEYFSGKRRPSRSASTVAGQPVSVEAGLPAPRSEDAAAE